ncbi:MAG: ImmA/IrrE family metallo-endopeptidase [Clostridia bacterium]|nr:ImmA/IrrE family metallo-endopeptidase [Clostridia bacterium]
MKVSVLAAEARDRLGFSQTEPIENIFKTLSVEGVWLVRYPFGMQSISALYTRCREQPIIAIDSSYTLGHQTFSAAHEIYHWLHDGDRLYSVCSPGDADSNTRSGEHTADRFASAFLMPEQGIKRRLARRLDNQDIELTDVFFLQQFYRVSFEAMLRRLRDIGILNAMRYRTFREAVSGNIKTLARQLGYPLDLYIADMAIEYPPDFIEMATKLYETGRISWMRLCELMAWVGIDPVSLELRHPEDPDHVV